MIYYNSLSIWEVISESGCFDTYLGNRILSKHTVTRGGINYIQPLSQQSNSNNFLCSQELPFYQSKQQDGQEVLNVAFPARNMIIPTAKPKGGVETLQNLFDWHVWIHVKHLLIFFYFICKVIIIIITIIGWILHRDLVSTEQSNYCFC